VEVIVRGLYIRLSEPTFLALTRRALDERRSTRDQASVELERLFPRVSEDEEPAEACEQEARP
jgi:hypothetical protein